MYDACMCSTGHGDLLIAVQVLERITSEETGYLSVQPGASVALLVNSLGSTTPMELSIVARAAVARLEQTFQVSCLHLRQYM